MADGKATRFNRASMWGLGIATAIVVIVVAVLAMGSVVDSETSPSGSPSASAAPAAPAAPSDSPTNGESLPPRPSPVQAPLNTESELVSGVVVSIGSLTAIDGIAEKPGEIAGPAVRVPVVFRNGSAAEVSLGSLVVSADYGSAKTPASELTGSAATPLPVTIGPGGSAEGVYVFTIPIEERDLVRISIDYAVDIAPIVFEGSAPK